MAKNNERIALEISKGAENNTFYYCDIRGKVKIQGKGTKMLYTQISQFQENHPTLWKSLLVTILGGIIIGLVLLEIEYKFLI